MIRCALMLMVLATTVSGRAQEHPYLSRFEITEQQGSVRLDWTMVAGNTCFNIEVWRGTGPSMLQRIDIISGLCGSITAPVDYAYTDNAPPELSTLYYQLVLGLSGSSSTKSIEFDQLATTEMRIVPDPDNGGVEVYLDTPLNADVDLRCWTMDGKLVYEATGRTGHRHHLPLHANTSGGLIVQAITNGRSITGRVVLAR